MNNSKLRIVGTPTGADEKDVKSAQPAPNPTATGADRAPLRLSRRVIRVGDHAVGVAAAGRGIPLVMVHGFGVESMLYAQTMARTAALGFRVIALDIAGHGDSQAIRWLPNLDDYVDLLDTAIDQLGITRAVFMGHSMGGRIVSELTARRPERTMALVLLDPIVGAQWDAMRPWLRWCPPALGAYGIGGAIDVLSTLPALVDARQAIKIGRQVRRSIFNLVSEPWNGLIAGAAVLRAAPSTDTLDAVRAANVPSVVVHGNADLLVPQAAALDAAHRLDATYVSVFGGRHSWMIRDPETLPAILDELLRGSLGRALHAAGINEAMTADERWAWCTNVAAQHGQAVGGADLEVILHTQRKAPHLRFAIA